MNEEKTRKKNGSADLRVVEGKITMNKIALGVLSAIIVALITGLATTFIGYGNRISKLEGKIEMLERIVNNKETLKERPDTMEKPISTKSERILALSPAPNTWGKTIIGSSGGIVFYDNSDCTFTGRIELIGLQPNHEYILTLNGKPPHPSNERLPEVKGGERVFNFLQVTTDSTGKIGRKDFNIKLQPGEYSVKFFVKEKDHNDWKIVLYNDFLIFTVNSDS